MMKLLEFTFYIHKDSTFHNDIHVDTHDDGNGVHCGGNRLHVRPL